MHSFSHLCRFLTLIWWLVHVQLKHSSPLRYFQHNPCQWNQNQNCPIGQCPLCPLCLTAPISPHLQLVPHHSQWPNLKTSQLTLIIHTLLNHYLSTTFCPTLMRRNLSHPNRAVHPPPSSFSTAPKMSPIHRKLVPET